MDKAFWLRAVWEVLRSALVYVVFCLFAMALAAIFVKASALGDGGIIAVNWSVKCVGVFLCCLLFIGRERTLFKGLAAGIIGCLLAMLVFALVGGGFHVTALFPLELIASALLGGAGALCGGKLHKE